MRHRKINTHKTTMYMCVCVCREREREREKDRHTLIIEKDKLRLAEKIKR